MKLNFEKCDISGQLKAEGNKGQYWIEEMAFTYVKLLEIISKRGPVITNIGTFNTVEDALEFVEIFDRSGGNDNG